MVFSDRKFIVIRDHSESIEKHDALETLIKQHNGEIVKWDERADVDVSPKLIIVSSTMNYERVEEMRRFMIPTVTERWIHFCVKEQKLVPMRPFSPDPRNFMRDIIACFSGLSEGDTDVFKAGIVASGGECTDMVTRYTTHVVATQLDTPECDLVLQSRVNNPKLGIKIVKPDWVDACMSLQTKVDDEPFVLDKTNNSAFVNEHTQPTQDLTGTYPVIDSPRLAVQQSMREALGSNILDGRRFYLGSDLELSEKVEKTVRYLIETNGGHLVNEISDAQVYLGKWREGNEYITASRRKIIIGNITWLYWTMIHQHFDKPSHLLHYPEVKGGLPQMKDYVICVTNYTGDARAYLQSLIHSMGATYSGKLIEQHTTHLITAYESGQKYEAAKKWKIPVVNHLWLEDSYAYWKPQDPSSRVYTYFPAKLSMSTLIGSRNLVHNVLLKFQNPEAEFSKAPHPKRQAKQKAGNWLHDAMIVENEFHKNLKRGKITLDESMLESVNETVEPKSPEPEHSPEVQKELQIKEPHKDLTDSKVSPKKTSVPIKTTPAPSPEPSTTPTPEPTPEPKSPSVHPKVNSQDKHRIMFSGVDDPPSNKACAKVGLSVVKTAPAKVLVAPKFMKTAKFLQCLAETEEFVKPEWVEACIRSNVLVPTDQYRIQDEGLSLALRGREKLNGKPLFEGMKLKLAPSLKDDAVSFKHFVKAHGGSISTRSGEDVLLIGEDVPWNKFIESMQCMDPQILKNF